MKKKLLITLLASTMLVSACNNEKTETKIETKVIETATSSDAPTVTAEAVNVTLTEENIELMKQYMRDSVTLDIIEIYTNGVLSGDYQTQVENNIQVCVKSGVTIATIDNNTFADRYTDEPMEELHLVRDTEGNWTEAQDKTYVLDWNITDFENNYDLYSFLTNDGFPKAGTEGIVSGDFIYYSVNEDASTVELEGIDYDEIEGKTTTYIVTDNVLQSIIIDIEFSKENVRYMTTATYHIEYSDKELEMPSYGQETE